MLILAQHKVVPHDAPILILARSNPLGALHIGHSITLKVVEHKGLLPLKYKTVSDFLDNWEVLVNDRHNIRVPFLKAEIGLGNVVRFFAEKFPMWVKEKFDGCEDRRAWLNMLVAFVPWGGQLDE